MMGKQGRPSKLTPELIERMDEYFSQEREVKIIGEDSLNPIVEPPDFPMFSEFATMENMDQDNFSNWAKRAKELMQKDGELSEDEQVYVNFFGSRKDDEFLRADLCGKERRC